MNEENDVNPTVPALSAQQYVTKDAEVCILI